MRSPETGMGEPKESPKAEVPVEAAPLSKELKDAMQKENERLRHERYELQETLEKELAAIVGIEPGDSDLEKADFKGVEAVRGVFEKNPGDLAGLQKALKELAVPLLLRMGTLGKVKRFADSPRVNRAVAIENQLEELRKKLSK